MAFTPEEQAAQLRKPSGDGALQIMDYMNRGNTLLYREVLNQLQIQPGHHLLELGQGNGYLVPQILNTEQNVLYSAIDFSEASVNIAMAENQPAVLSGKARFALGNISDLPFDKQVFDTVFGINVLYFWEQPETELKEIFRVLKPNGTFILGYRPKNKMQQLPFTQFGFQLYEPIEVENLLLQSGFTQAKSMIFEDAERVVNSKTIKMDAAVTLAFKP